MDKTGFLQEAMKMLREKSSVDWGDFMRDMKNWCVVHTTRYMPHTDPNGTMYIHPLSKDTDFKFPRTTMHFTLNHTVGSHLGGSWDDAAIVVLAPYKDVVRFNGNPVEVAGADTYWSVNPDQGLRFPPSAYIIKPDDNGALFQIGEHGATYKTKNFTEDQIKDILDLMSPYEIEQYNMSMNDDRNAMLAHFLRDAVVKMSMNQMGMSWAYDFSDGSEVNRAIVDAAEAMGIQGKDGDKSHTFSIYGYIDEYSQNVNKFLEDGLFGTPGIFETDIKSLYDVMTEWREYGISIVPAVIDDLISNKPINFLKWYQDCYVEWRKDQMDSIERTIEDHQKFMDNIVVGVYYRNYSEVFRNKEIQEFQAKILNLKKQMQKLSEKQTIADYDKNLWESIQRHCNRLSLKYQAWRLKLVQNPEYANLVQKLRKLSVKRNIPIMHDRVQ